MTRDKINQKIEAARKKHGDYNDGKLILLRNTYHECAPGHDYLWCAEAVYLDTKKMRLGLFQYIGILRILLKKMVTGTTHQIIHGKWNQILI
ncbi:MAG: hypothetical protein GY861_01185 [bacterium]|nr:hypothetical protein [bacterium]